MISKKIWIKKANGFQEPGARTVSGKDPKQKFPNHALPYKVQKSFIGNKTEEISTILTEKIDFRYGVEKNVKTVFRTFG